MSRDTNPLDVSTHVPGPSEATPVVVRVEPLLVGVPAAGRMLGVSTMTIRRMIAADELPSVLLGGRRLPGVADLAVWVAEFKREYGAVKEK